MKTRLTALLVGALLMAGGLCAQAQPKANDEKKDRTRWTEEELIQRRAERMASALMLDDKTEADFIVLYKQYLTDMKSCREQYREKVSKTERKDNDSPLTDEKIVERIEKRFDQQRQLLNVREKYYKDFKKMLTPKQLLRIFDEKRPVVDHYRHWDPMPEKNARRNAHRYHYGCCPWHR